MSPLSRLRFPRLHVAHVVAIGLVAAAPAWAQQRATAQSVSPAPVTPAIGSMAPDFSLPGATRYGPLRTPVRLSDFRGQAVVLAFFPKARTKG